MCLHKHAIIIPSISTMASVSQRPVSITCWLRSRHWLILDLKLLELQVNSVSPLPTIPQLPKDIQSSFLTLMEPMESIFSKIKSIVLDSLSTQWPMPPSPKELPPLSPLTQLTLKESQQPGHLPLTLKEITEETSWLVSLRLILQLIVLRQLQME